MAEQLKDIRIRLKSVENTKQITKAMQMVSNNKLRKAQHVYGAYAPYAARMAAVTAHLLRDKSETPKHPFLQAGTGASVLLAVVGSDKGLCGSYNAHLFKKVGHILTQTPQAHYTLLPIGRKAYDYFKIRANALVADYRDLHTNCTYEKVRACADFMRVAFEAGAYQRIVIVSMRFVNTLIQESVVTDFLPLRLEEPQCTQVRPFCYEPEAEAVLAELLPQLLRALFYEKVLGAQVAEHAARVTAMDQATENAETMLSELKLSYNRVRQAVITKEINEIIGGASA